MTALFANNAVSTLAAPVGVNATTLPIQASDAQLFPAFTGGGGEWFPATIIASTGEIEIVRVTARNGSVLTVARAQEGTRARAFVAGAKVELRLTAGTLAEMAGDIKDVSEGLEDAAEKLSQAVNISTTAVGGIPAGSVMNALIVLDTKKTSIGHGHTVADVQGLKTALDKKIDADALPPGVPVGSIVAFGAAKPPAGWLVCNGAAVSRETYPDLFTAIGTAFGAGDGASTFNLPDLRGEFVRGWDNGRGVDAGRKFGSGQAEEIGPHHHGMSQLRFWGRIGNGGNNMNAEFNTENAGTQRSIATDENDGAETRPRNVALLYCIKAFERLADPAQVSAAAVVADVAALGGRVNDIGTAIRSYLHVVEEQASGSFGASGVVAAKWNSRVLNTIIENTINGASLANNQVILPAGTYDVLADCVSMRSYASRARLYDATNKRMLLLGVPVWASTGSSGEANAIPLAGRITLNAKTTLQLEYYVAAGSGYTAGYPCSTGDPERFANLIIQKVA